MKHISKKTIYIVVIFLIAGFLVLGYNYTAANLKSFVVNMLEDNFGTKLSIAHMRISFPLCLELKDVKINDTISISKVYIYPSLESVFLKKPYILSSIRIVEPVVKMSRIENDNFAHMVYLKNITFKNISKDSKALFYVSRIDVQNGTFIYDLGNKNRLEVVKINLNLKGPYIYLPGAKSFNFKAAGFVKNQNSEALSPISAGGLITQDFTIKAKLRAQDVALETLGDIYNKYLKKKVVNGNLDLETKIFVSKKDVKADCMCRVNDIILKGANQKIAAPLIASFILGFDFKEKALRINNLQTNLFSLLLNRF